MILFLWEKDVNTGVKELRKRHENKNWARINN